MKPSRKSPGLRVLLGMLRVHQWLKNSLLFVPMLAAHELSNVGAWRLAAMAFLAFSLCASSVYIVNDLVDIESDRRHVRKHARAFASGAVPARVGFVLAPMLLLGSFGVAVFVGVSFVIWLAVYILLTSLYTWKIKRIVLVDCIALAFLYTIRVLAGASAVGHQLSFWLLAFSVFIFLSLAFVKRYAELESQRSQGSGTIHGRGYHTADASLIQTMGITAGQVAVLVFALYLNSEAVLVLYRSPQIVWGGVLILLFWINWVWVQAHRGNMHDDPLIFAIKDRVSLLAGLLFAGVLAVGAIGLQW